MRRTEKVLRGYEQSLGMVARYQAVCLLADEQEAAAEDNAPPQRLRALAARLPGACVARTGVDPSTRRRADLAGSGANCLC